METANTDSGPQITAMGQELKSFTAAVKGSVEKLESLRREDSSRLLTIEQHLSAGPVGASGISGDKSLGQTIVESDGWANMQKGNRSTGRLAVKSLAPAEQKLVSGSWSAAPDFRPVMAFPPQPQLPVRALMPNLVTSSNLVEFPVEVSFVNNAGYQTTEGTDKPQSDATYTLQQQPICVLAHWIPASRQLLDDSDAFRNYIDNRLVFMLEKIVEQEILFGSGATAHLRGLWTAATPATETQTGLIESVGASISQLAALGIQPDACVISPQDWWSARLAKTTVGDFVLGSPLVGLQPSLWGLRVAVSVSMPQGSYLVGNFQNGAAIYDRQQNVLEISREHDRYFVQNMAAILVETRLALAVFSPISFVRGSVGPGS